ncbi:acyl-CoA synthetase FdrA [Mannheimia indoligenes]|uniref:Acyl-CoA synthetase FdrA n=1 Tax=Mannheimia indoligenes TaxID=3103145 RepID=A0ABU7ZEB2_9PAST
MLKTVVKKGSYHDSVVLMLLTNAISGLDGVKKVSVMMATPANKDIFAQSGLDTPELLDATANDMVVVADIEQEDVINVVMEKVEAFLKQKSQASSAQTGTEVVKSWDKATAKLPDANLAVISIPGAYAALEANRALDEGLNVFMFSDNVSVEDEKALKEKAHSKGLVVMGADCGTGIIQGVPVAFTNSVTPGFIGIIGASGTGIQELTTIIDRLGEGVENAIGTGGRDLYEDIGGITMLDTIEAMEQNDKVKVLIVISKPPAKAVREKISARLSRYTKPVITLFLGEKPTFHEENFYHAYTLDEAARLAVALVRNEPIPTFAKNNVNSTACGKTLKAYYSGGTLAGEAAMLLKDALKIEGSGAKADGFMFKQDGHIVVDLGDDVYTQGKPHPMIDPAKRIESMREAVDDATTGVILFDIVLGYGSHEDMATALIPTIQELQQKAKAQNRDVAFVATVCGTRSDYQGYDETVRKLKDAGVEVCETNKIAVEKSLALLGLQFDEPEKPIKAKTVVQGENNPASEQLLRLLSEKPKIINIGLKSFADVAEKFGCQVVQFNWQPPAGGNIQLIKALNFLNEYEGLDIDEANRKVIAKVVAAAPIIRDNVLAKTVIKELNEGKVILHAGPPIQYKDMPNTVQGSCVGAVLFEKWATDEASARALLESGEIKFMPCHHVNAVGPMGGITTANMPVWVVENATDGNSAYCTMNEGIGKVLRFGAYSDEVVKRLEWMRDILGPTLGKAIRSMENGLAVNPLVAKAIAMGDEFHQRNIAASMSFFKEVAPRITAMSDLADNDKYDVIKFLADTDQFFLNIMMAASKAIMDGARTITDGTVVTAMCRNGVHFGIRIAGMGDEWFVGPVNTPQGLYFTGYDGEDACPDIGDSAITETLGVGGMAMIAAPAVTRFVGAGGYEDALRTSNDMMEICIDRNPNYVVPNWNFQGACLGVDARLVVEKGITPVINTGIAHKIAGFGQIGAGTVRPPLACFEKAVLAYARKLGFKE